MIVEFFLENLTTRMGCTTSQKLMIQRVIFILLAGNAASFSATLSLVELASETPDLTTPNGAIDQNLFNGGPGGIDSTLDITLQFEAEALSNLRFYEGTFVDSVPEPSTSLLAALAGLALFAKRRR